MAMHEFLTYQEAIDRLGSPETVRQALLTWDLEAYVEFNTDTASAAESGSLPTSNGTRFASWKQCARLVCGADPDIEYPSEEDYEEELYYELFGWFVMRPPDACDIARSPGRDVRLTLFVSPATNDFDGSAGLLSSPHFEADYTTRLEKLWFRRGGIDKLLPSGRSDTGKTGGDTAPWADQTKSNVGPSDQDSADERPEGGATDAQKPQEYEPSTYLPVIQALVRLAKPSHRNLAGDVTNALHFLAFRSCGEAAVEKLLATASELKSTETADSCEHDRSIYLPVIRMLAVFSGCSGRGDIQLITGQMYPYGNGSSNARRGGGGTDSASGESRRRDYGPSNRTIWQLLRDARRTIALSAANS